MPGSPASWRPLALVSSNTRSPTWTVPVGRHGGQVARARWRCRTCSGRSVSYRAALVHTVPAALGRGSRVGVEERVEAAGERGDRVVPGGGDGAGTRAPGPARRWPRPGGPGRPSRPGSRTRPRPGPGRCRPRPSSPRRPSRSTRAPSRSRSGAARRMSPAAMVENWSSLPAAAFPVWNPPWSPNRSRMPRTMLGPSTAMSVSHGRRVDGEPVLPGVVCGTSLTQARQVAGTSSPEATASGRRVVGRPAGVGQVGDQDRGHAEVGELPVRLVVRPEGPLRSGRRRRQSPAGRRRCPTSRPCR